MHTFLFLSERKTAVRKLYDKNEISKLGSMLCSVAVYRSWCLPPRPRVGVFNPQSHFWGLYNDDVLVGGLCLVQGGPKGLPLESVWPEQGHITSPDICEIFYLIVQDGQGGLKGFIKLCTAMFQWCDTAGINYLLTCITKESQRRYEYTGISFEIKGNERDHWGHPSLLLGVSMSSIRSSLFGGSNFAQRYARKVWQSIKQAV